ncbi:histone-like nucleoid-structuring protein Lsr2 [Streptomyces halstedii]|uniref:Lsr2 family DNA-binding protein n=1 Tax=Streptomyces halstedii TaxID=1944 RepID=UPI0037F61080
MATNAIPVTADQKDEPGVQAIKVQVPGVGEVEAYVQVVTTDDVDEKTTKGVETYSFSLPVEEEEETEELDAEGAPVFNEDGSKRIKVEKYWTTRHFELDMSPTSRDKMIKALAPFTKNAREKRTTFFAGSPKPQTLGPDAATVRRWAQENDIKVNNKPVNDMGRVSQAFIDLYEKAHA